ncbi:unnamed protein product [Cladocopium goreaui]|uniref:DUF5110 domain-containing protein n=1 Tax=Cladocopium goreaui TaxID=2562237 RepID=A0A9P1DP91_9DINO|nr:unnamed protein product [Cladocopium goreaui]
MGLWTSTGLANASWEIGNAKSRVIKTDVAWVGSGYRFGLEAVKLAARLMTNSSDSRPYTWTVCGWAGTQKYAVIWTGDNTGSWEYIRMQIPTVIGSGLSGFAHATGDVDGIYGGSPETYVRDLQWKTFLTVAMTMSGWAKYDKQPWTFGEPYTSYNRKWLQLKASLTPYLYSLAFQAYLTGEPPVRAMELEFPHEIWSNKSALQYQFMSGPSFLVAPVFRNETHRDHILLASGEWIDYSDGFTRYSGPRTLDSYPCPLENLPVFVRAGAIIPMWPQLDYVGQKTVDVLTLDLFPPSTASTSNFTLYEDDGLTRNYSMGAVASQTFQMRTASNGMLEFCIGRSKGSYQGQLSRRSYWLQVHSSEPAKEIKIEGETIDHVPDEEHRMQPSGWYNSKGGGFRVKTPVLEVSCICTAMRWSETGGVVSDTGARLAWEREIRKAEANKTSTLTSWPKGTSTWAFEFRSYTNQEELNAMLAAKPGLQQLLLRPANRTSLQVDGEIAELEDNFLLLGGLVVVKIRWRGKALASMLRWDTSEAVLSSSVLPWLQRTFDRPAAAERLRKDPWELTAMVEPTVSGIKRSVAVLRRVGAGRLVFMKQ